MNSTVAWRFVVILLVGVFCALMASPLDEKINLGLDLQGGMYLVYEVDADNAVTRSIEGSAADLEKYLKDQGVIVSSSRRVDQTIEVTLPSAAQSEKALEIIDEEYTILEKVDTVSDRRFLFAFTRDYRRTVYENSIDQSLETLRNRIDEFGVAEPVIQREGGNRILIQLPGVKDRERAKKIIGRTARLEFRMLDEKTTVTQAMASDAPTGSEILYEKVLDPATGNVISKTPMVVKRKVELGGDTIANAKVSVDNMNQPYVSVEFNREGARVFAQITTANVKKRMAIILDDSIYSAPVIQEPITGGSASINGSFTYEEARDLALVLRAGALSAHLELLEERSVGPSLGADSVNRGITSILVGGVIVLIFMLVYYRLGGVVSDIALLLNMLILAGFLGYFGATLTLPGIAGIILTIGMAVDANVLVFERIREELRVGKTVRAAVESGFEKAFYTIIDANVTTLIAAMVLFQFGTGPVKGFAVTLTIGIIASMFTAIFVSRTFFLWYMGGRRITDLKI
jgi:preprotein translocase subunit SecD